MRVDRDCKCYINNHENQYPHLAIVSAAKNAYHSNPENTAFDAKRLIGRKLDDPEVERDQKH